MEIGIQVYKNDEGDTVTAYKIYSRTDVQYKAKFVLTDINNNSITYTFNISDLTETWGADKLKKAFMGKGLKPLDIVDVTKLYNKFYSVHEEMVTTTMGQSSSASILSIKNQLLAWYQEAQNGDGLLEMKVKLEDGSEYNISTENEKDKKNDISNKKKLIICDKIQNDNVLLISCAEFKKWLTWSGYAPNRFIKKMVQAGIMYIPNTSANPRYHHTSSGEWYRAIYIDKLNLMDIMG